MRRLLAAVAGGMLARRLRSLKKKQLDETVARVAAGELDLEGAAKEILESDVWRDD